MALSHERREPREPHARMSAMVPVRYFVCTFFLLLVFVAVVMAGTLAMANVASLAYVAGTTAVQRAMGSYNNPQSTVAIPAPQTQFIYIP